MTTLTRPQPSAATEQVTTPPQRVTEVVTLVGLVAALAAGRLTVACTGEGP